MDPSEITQGRMGSHAADLCAKLVNLRRRTETVSAIVPLELAYPGPQEQSQQLRITTSHKMCLGESERLTNANDDSRLSTPSYSLHTALGAWSVRM